MIITLNSRLAYRYSLIIFNKSILILRFLNSEIRELFLLIGREKKPKFLNLEARNGRKN